LLRDFLFPFSVLFFFASRHGLCLFPLRPKRLDMSSSSFFFFDRGYEEDFTIVSYPDLWVPAWGCALPGLYRPFSLKILSPSPFHTIFPFSFAVHRHVSNFWENCPFYKLPPLASLTLFLRNPCLPQPALWFSHIDLYSLAVRGKGKHFPPFFYPPAIPFPLTCPAADFHPPVESHLFLPCSFPPQTVPVTSPALVEIPRVKEGCLAQLSFRTPVPLNSLPCSSPDIFPPDVMYSLARILHATLRSASFFLFSRLQRFRTIHESTFPIPTKAFSIFAAFCPPLPPPSCTV